MTRPDTSASVDQDTADALLELTVSGFNAGVLSLANNILRWLDERPMFRQDALVIELRANLEEVRDGIRNDIQQSMRLSRPTDD